MSMIDVGSPLMGTFKSVVFHSMPIPENSCQCQAIAHESDTTVRRESMARSHLWNTGQTVSSFLDIQNDDSYCQQSLYKSGIHRISITNWSIFLA